MPHINEDKNDPVVALDQWFRAHCDGLWEHGFGIKIETTDNPGWLLTVHKEVDQSAIPKIEQYLRTEVPSAEFKINDSEIRIWAPTLMDCLRATSIFLPFLGKRH